MPPDPSSGLAINEDVAPQMATAPDGSIWVAASSGFEDSRRGLGGVVPREDDPLAYQATGDVWVSRNGGRSYRWVAAPFSSLPGHPGLGGSDVDIAVATQRNRHGYYNIYVASWWVALFSGAAFLGDQNLAVSEDGGRSWRVDELAGTLPLDDHPLLAADGACIVYLAYHALPTATLAVQRFDVCNALDTARGATLDALNSSRVVSFTPALVTGKPGTYVLVTYGKPVVDTLSASPYRHHIYIAAVDCPPQTLSQDLPRASSPEQRCAGPHSEAYLLESDDHGTHWTLHRVSESPYPIIPIWGPSLAMDRAGTLYMGWYDHHGMYLVASRDGGRTWSRRRQLATGTVNAIADPTLAAGRRGHVRIALYGTTRTGDPEDPAAMGKPGAPGAAVWSIYAMSSRDGGNTFTAPAPLVDVHTGTVCIDGATDGPQCNIYSPSNTLFSQIGVSVSPPNGETAIAYSSDLPGGGYQHEHVEFALTP
jgi:hypothetical protein